MRQLYVLKAAKNFDVDKIAYSVDKGFRLTPLTIHFLAPYFLNTVLLYAVK
jgi:hypothetical protein